MSNCSKSTCTGTDPLIAYATGSLGGVVRADNNLVAHGPDVRRTVARFTGLSKGHIKPRMGTLTIAKGGGLIKVTRAGPFKPPFVHHNRGEVKPLSDKARRRMLYAIASIKREIIPDFVTLTYPGRFEGDVRTIKSDLNNFGKRLVRLGAAAIWRLEYKERLTGDSQGEIVPHYHLFVWWPNGMTIWERRKWLSNAWFEIAGHGSLDHLEAGTSCEVIRSWRGVSYYAAKYITKDVEGQLPDHCGRQWGWINYDLVPWSEMETEAITNDQCWHMFHILRDAFGDHWSDYTPSMTVLVDSPEHWRTILLTL